MTRVLQPELLDTLPADDPAAAASRRDLRRVNRWMGHRRILRPAIGAAVPQPPRRIVELGAGDGTLALQLAKRLSPAWRGVQLTLVDQQRLVSEATLAAFGELGWAASVATADVFAWLQHESVPCDLVFTNLFLHHFETRQLRLLLAAVSERTGAFVALEPRRRLFARWSCELLWLIGCNRVTRHDARVSVAAGFHRAELSSLWPAGGGWRLHETPAGLFSHLFIACRHSA